MISMVQRASLGGTTNRTEIVVMNFHDIHGGFLGILFP